MTEPETVAVTHGYACRHTPTVMDGPVYRWSPAGFAGDRFEVSASRNGVMLHGGSPILAGPGVRQLERVLALALRAAELLAARPEPTAEAVRALIRSEATP